MAITGGCLCGQLRYAINAEPLAARTCWCRLCQFLGGGTATANVAFPADRVAITGETTDFVSIADSGAHLHRRFCPRCGTPISSAAEERPHLIFLRAGTLDDPNLIAPQATIWTDAAPDWACISASIPSHPRQVPPVS